MKKAAGLVIVAVLMFIQAEISWAVVGTRSFTVGASVPAATSVSMTASNVATTGGTFTQIPTGTGVLGFGTLSYSATNGSWVPDHNFAVDIAPDGGSGNVTTVVTYTEGTNRNVTTGHGLGYKAFATFMKVTGSGTATSETAIPSLGKMRLIDMTGGITVNPATVTSGWLRVYLGLSTGAAGEPAGLEPFTNGDTSGSYDGSITFSATLS